MYKASYEYGIYVCLFLLNIQLFWRIVQLQNEWLTLFNIEALRFSETRYGFYSQSQDLGNKV